MAELMFLAGALEERKKRHLNRSNDGLKEACEKGNFYDVRSLLKPKYQLDPSFDYNYCIQIAAWNNHYDVVELLLSDSRVDPNDALEYAITKRHYRIIKLLINDHRINFLI